MEVLLNQNQDSVGTDVLSTFDKKGDAANNSKGSSMLDSDFGAALDQAFDMGANCSGKPQNGSKGSTEPKSELLATPDLAPDSGANSANGKSGDAGVKVADMASSSDEDGEMFSPEGGPNLDVGPGGHDHSKHDHSKDKKVDPSADGINAPLPDPSADGINAPLPDPSADGINAPLPDPSADGINAPLPDPSADGINAPLPDSNSQGSDDKPEKTGAKTSDDPLNPDQGSDDQKPSSEKTKSDMDLNPGSDKPQDHSKHTGKDKGKNNAEGDVALNPEAEGSDDNPANTGTESSDDLANPDQGSDDQASAPPQNDSNSELQPISGADEEPKSFTDTVKNSKTPEDIRKTLFPNGGFEGIDGDFLDPKGGNNIVLGSDNKHDFVFGNGGGFNFIKSGEGIDHIVLGKDTTNFLLDFDAKSDRLVLDDNVKLTDVGAISFGDNTMLIDKTSNSILAALANTKPEDVSASGNFLDGRILDSDALKLSLDAFGEDQFFANVKQDNGLLNGTDGRDKLTGGDENDILSARSTVADKDSSVEKDDSADKDSSAPKVS
jgi:hypothetical protein